MHLPAHHSDKTRRVFVLMLILVLISFAIWLKLSPNLGMSLRAGGQTSVKLWLDPSHVSDTQIKFAPLASLFLFAFLIPALILRPARSMGSVQVVKFVARDIFTESRHWFRPPPLF